MVSGVGERSKHSDGVARQLPITNRAHKARILRRSGGVRRGGDEGVTKVCRLGWAEPANCASPQRYPFRELDGQAPDFVIAEPITP
jgi:hypothetical protein